MQRLAQFDVSRQFLTKRSKVIAEITFGMVCAATMMGLRSFLDLWAPESGPFALVYPAVLLATLYGHWVAGLTTFSLSFAWAWYFVLRPIESFAFQDSTDSARVAINAIAALVVLVFAEAFRRAARSTMAEIRAAADRRLVLLAELEHRTKNNFALVASLLEIQKRRLGNAELDAPLNDAVLRVRTFADAYSNLAMEQEEGAEVEIKPYLEQLIDRVTAAAMPRDIEVRREIDSLALPREVGVAIGLYVNEALSNCAKYAFPEGSAGTVVVRFTADPVHGWTLLVEDNGAGASTPVASTGGLGSRLLEAFANQARATHLAGATTYGFRTQLKAAA